MSDTMVVLGIIGAIVAVVTSTVGALVFTLKWFMKTNSGSLEKINVSVTKLANDVMPGNTVELHNLAVKFDVNTQALDRHADANERAHKAMMASLTDHVKDQSKHITDTDRLVLNDLRPNPNPTGRRGG